VTLRALALYLIQLRRAGRHKPFGLANLSPQKEVDIPMTAQDLITQINESLFSGLAIKPVTQGLVQHLWWDLPLSLPELVDFGVETSDHYRALRAILLYPDEEPAEAESEAASAKSLALLRERILALDDAYGDSRKLNQLVAQYAPAYAGTVYFKPTTWDVLYGRTEEDTKSSG
jgi:hypothetical protein